jgi:hypothetical protein
MEKNMQKKAVLLGIFIFIVFPELSLEGTNQQSLDQLKMDKIMASKFAQMAMKCIEKEYPNKPSHVMNSEKEIWSPRQMHPVFYGCFDWHSAVHGHWMLIRLLKIFPDLPNRSKIRDALNRNLTAEHILREVHYFKQKGRKSFERTYGWAWLLKLAEELDGWNDPQGKTWRQNIKPLEEEIVRKYLDFLPKQTYPIRTGVHPNTAFGLAFALDYARKVNHESLTELIIERSYTYYKNDKNCPAIWEPGGEDFFSPCLMEADLMRRILKPKEFTSWFHQFLPDIKNRKPKILLEPAMVTDRSDGKLVHLDGLNLSRAWCMFHIASALPDRDAARKVLIKSALKHTNDALKNIHSGDYAGEHWLASFAIYVLTSKN